MNMGNSKLVTRPIESKPPNNNGGPTFRTMNRPYSGPRRRVIGQISAQAKMAPIALRLSTGWADVYSTTPRSAIDSNGTSKVGNPV